LISLYDADESTGGLVVIPDSQLLHKEVAERRGSKGTFDLVFIPIHDPVLRTPGQLVKCKSGDLVLWDSRTIHCNSPALLDVKENKEKKEWDLQRAVAYICMTPASKATKHVIEQRIKAVEIGQGTNHWPHEFSAIGPPRKWDVSLGPSQWNLVTGS